MREGWGTREVSESKFVICRLAKEFPVGGGSYGLGPNFYYISIEQAKLGNNVHVIALKDKGSKSCETVKGVRVHRVRTPYNLTALAQIRKIDRGEKVDVVHAHATTGISYSLFHKFKRDTLFVVHVHGISIPGMSYAYSTFTSYLKASFWHHIGLIRQKIMWKQADVLIAVSKDLKANLVKVYDFPDEKVRVVYNGVDVNLFKPIKCENQVKSELGIKDKKLVLFVGSFRPVKGIHHLIDSIPEVVKKVKDCHFLLIGGIPQWVRYAQTYLEELKRKVVEYSLRKHVRFMDALPHRMLPYYYSAADVFVLSSVYDPLPKVVLEAMACGTPVVASRVGGVPEMLNHGVEGLIVPPENPSALAEALTTILSDEKLARDMGRQGREKILSRFTWRHTALNLDKVYGEFIADNAHYQPS